MAKTAAEMVRGAFERARGRTAAVHYIGTSAGGYAAYSVDSSMSTDSAYTVTVRGDEYRCTCPSEQRFACWHRAAVAMVRASRKGFGLAADGPSAEDERAARAAQTATARLAFERLLSGDVVGAERIAAPLRSCESIAALFAA